MRVVMLPTGALAAAAFPSTSMASARETVPLCCRHQHARRRIREPPTPPRSHASLGSGGAPAGGTGGGWPRGTRMQTSRRISRPGV